MPYADDATDTSRRIAVQCVALQMRV